jgi:hypothetical protein
MVNLWTQRSFVERQIILGQRRVAVRTAFSFWRRMA